MKNEPWVPPGSRHLDLGGLWAVGGRTYVPLLPSTCEHRALGGHETDKEAPFDPFASESWGPAGREGLTTILGWEDFSRDPGRPLIPDGTGQRGGLLLRVVQTATRAGPQEV